MNVLFVFLLLNWRTETLEVQQDPLPGVFERLSWLVTVFEWKWTRQGQVVVSRVSGRTGLKKKTIKAQLFVRENLALIDVKIQRIRFKMQLSVTLLFLLQSAQRVKIFLSISGLDKSVLILNIYSLVILEITWNFIKHNRGPVWPMWLFGFLYEFISLIITIIFCPSFIFVMKYLEMTHISVLVRTSPMSSWCMGLMPVCQSSQSCPYMGRCLKNIQK